MNMDAISLRGKTCVITGAGRGVGLNTTQRLVRAGCDVVMAVRSPQQVSQVADELNAQGPGRVEVMELDIASFASVRRFAAAYKRTGKPIHILVCNAGVMAIPHRVTADGMDEQYQINCAGHYLLVRLLVEVLKASAPCRVVNLTSVLHHTVSGLNQGYAEGDVALNPTTAYGMTKLCNLLFTYELHRRLAGTGVNVIAVHPGNFPTEITTQWFGRLSPVINFLAMLLAWFTWCIGLGGYLAPISKSGRMPFYAAAAPSLEGRSGIYLTSTTYAPVDSSQASRDPAAAEWLWDTLQRQTHAEDASALPRQ